MELRHLKTFIAVALERSFSRGAERLFKSQPVVTRTIKDLEYTIGRQLFIRGGRELALTREGEVLFPYAQRILALTEESINVVQQISSPCEEIRIGFPATALIFHVIECVRKTNRLFVPSMRFQEGNYRELVGALRDGVIDVALMHAVPQNDNEDFFRKDFLILDLWAVVPLSHHLAGKKSIQLSDLCGEVFVTLDRHLFMKSDTDLPYSALENSGCMPKKVIEVNSVMSALAQVAAGSGIGLFPRNMSMMAIPGLIYIPIDDAIDPVSLSCYYLRSNTRAVVLSFVESLSDYLSGFVGRRS